MNISQVAQLTGLSSKTIRHYEKIGLINPPERGENGYRQYHRADIDTLHFIKHAREVDFSLAQIAELLALRNNPQRASADVKALVGAHIDALAQKITHLNKMKNTLENWHTHCLGNHSPDCAIIEHLTLFNPNPQTPLK